MCEAFNFQLSSFIPQHNHEKHEVVLSIQSIKLSCCIHTANVNAGCTTVNADACFDPEFERLAKAEDVQKEYRVQGTGGRSSTR